ncbi:pectin lyase-like protein [Mycena rebaudengoi]|nr:pectin lyase-like protein [Mycena rebaudengoi]
MFARLSVLAILVALVSTAMIDKRAAPINQLVGYATLNGGTTGGAGGPTTIVTSLAALRTAVTGATPKIVEISGIITGVANMLIISNSTTVVGIGSNSGVTGGGFRVKKGTNVIFRNLQLSKSPAPTDLIELQTSTNIWVDFTSDLTHDKDFYDGQLDMNHGRVRLNINGLKSFVTVSWNVFQQHFKCSLVGGSDNTGDEDSGHLRVTYHHNHFLEINSRTPSLRFGTAHIYSNFFDNVLDSAVDSRDGAQTLIEDNQFTNVVNPIETTLNGGFAVQRSNVFTNTTIGAIAAGTLTSLPYTYTADSAASVASIVPASAGAGKVTGL